jgi:foldase protein PrsA
VGVTPGEEEKTLSTAIFAAKPGVLGGPVSSPFGYYIYEVKSITPGSQESLAKAEAEIKQALTSTQGQAALTKFVKEFKKKWEGKTECRSGFVVQDCKSYKASKAGSTAATG